jgi:hypothetical protein
MKTLSVTIGCCYKNYGHSKILGLDIPLFGRPSVISRLSRVGFSVPFWLGSTGGIAASGAPDEAELPDWPMLTDLEQDSVEIDGGKYGVTISKIEMSNSSNEGLLLQNLTLKTELENSSRATRTDYL